MQTQDITIDDELLDLILNGNMIMFAINSRTWIRLYNHKGLSQ